MPHRPVVSPEGRVFGLLAPQMACTVLPFLDGKSGSKSWSEPVKESRRIPAHLSDCTGDPTQVVMWREGEGKIQWLKLAACSQLCHLPGWLWRRPDTGFEKSSALATVSSESRFDQC